MQERYLHDRYSIKNTRLAPQEKEHDRLLVEILKRLGAAGRVYHLMQVIPDQFEDIYTILVDDRLVVRFELPRTPGALAGEVQVEQFEDHRNHLGQGTARIRLDRWAEAARRTLAGDRKA